LAIVGDGELRSALERRASELGLSEAVHFLGFRHDLVSITAATDIAVLCSLNEGTPVALIEAAAAGKPAIATDVGGVRDIVTPSSGRLVAPGDISTFARALVELNSDPLERATLGTAARRHVREAFAVERLVADLDRLYRELLQRREGAVRGAAQTATR